MLRINYFSVIRRVLALVLLLALPVSGGAASPDGELKSMVVCKSPGKVSVPGGEGKAVRMLRMYSQGGDAGCIATYSKTNVERTVGTSRMAGQCQSILEGIRKNLESSQWSCKAAASAKVMKSNLADETEKAMRESEAEAALEKELN